MMKIGLVLKTCLDGSMFFHTWYSNSLNDDLKAKVRSNSLQRNYQGPSTSHYLVH